MDISFEWMGLDDVIAEFDKRISVVTFEVKDWEKLGNFLVSYIKSEIQNEGHVVTGELLGSIRILEIGEDYIDIGSDVLQARILEYGRGPVVASEGKVLHWVDKSTGEDVFAKSVGPVEPTHIFERSIITGLEAYKKQETGTI